MRDDSRQEGERELGLMGRRTVESSVSWQVTALIRSLITSSSSLSRRTERGIRLGGTVTDRLIDGSKLSAHIIHQII